MNTGHEIYAFEAQAVNLITLDIDVTDFLPGTLFGNDDSRLFLFNDPGEFLDCNDDFDGLQSRIEDFFYSLRGSAS